MCLDLPICALSSQLSPRSDRCDQDTGKQCEGEQGRMRNYREESREGAGLKGKMHGRQAAGITEHSARA